MSIQHDLDIAIFQRMAAETYCKKTLHAGMYNFNVVILQQTTARRNVHDDLRSRGVPQIRAVYQPTTDPVAAPPALSSCSDVQNRVFLWDACIVDYYLNITNISVHTLIDDFNPLAAVGQ